MDPFFGGVSLDSSSATAVFHSDPDGPTERHPPDRAERPGSPDLDLPSGGQDVCPERPGVRQDAGGGVVGKVMKPRGPSEILVGHSVHLLWSTQVPLCP